MNARAAVVVLALAGICAAQQVREEAKIAVNSPVRMVVACDNGAQLFADHADGSLVLWSVAGGAQKTVEKPAQRVSKRAGRRRSSLACSADGKWLAASSNNGWVFLFDAATGRLARKLQISHRDLPYIAFSPDGALLAVTREDAPAELWDVRSGKRVAALETSAGGANAVAFSPDGRRVVLSGEDTTTRVFDRGGKQLSSSSLSLLEDFAVSFSPDSREVAVAGADRTIKLMDVSTGKVVKTAAAQHDPIFQLMFVPDGSAVAELQLDEFTLKPAAIRLWNVRSDAFQDVAVDPARIVGAGTSKDALLLIRADDEKTITVLSVR